MAALQAAISALQQRCQMERTHKKKPLTRLFSQRFQSGNVTQAQAGLAKLQELSKASSSQAPLAATAPVDTDGDNDGSNGVYKTSLDATA